MRQSLRELARMKGAGIVATWRDKRTNALVSDATRNRSISHGGKASNFVKVSEVDLSEPTEVIRTLDDLYFDQDNYEEFEDVTYDGGADYGEE